MIFRVLDSLPRAFPKRGQESLLTVRGQEFFLTVRVRLRFRVRVNVKVTDLGTYRVKDRVVGNLRVRFKFGNGLLQKTSQRCLRSRGYRYG